MKLSAPAAARNKEPIREVLARYVPTEAHEHPVVEIASGSGEHAVHMARAFPKTKWQPTDTDPAAVASIAAWREETQLPNLLAPVQLDVASSGWPQPATKLVVCINMIHIAPWESALALFSGAARVLFHGGHLILYGPFRFFGHYTAASNQQFDESLRSRDPSWGVRDLADICPAAAQHAFVLHEIVAMPANNHCVILTRT